MLLMKTTKRKKTRKRKATEEEGGRNPQEEGAMNARSLPKPEEGHRTEDRTEQGGRKQGVRRMREELLKEEEARVQAAVRRHGVPARAEEHRTDGGRCLTGKSDMKRMWTFR